MEDERVIKLIEALDRAHECREGSAVDAVCAPCWADVDAALGAVRKAYKPQSRIWTPSV